MSTEQAVRARLDALRDALQARHGWTHLEITVDVDRSTGHLRLRGELAVARLFPRVIAAVREVVPSVEIDTHELRVMAGGRWHALVGPASLQTTCPIVDPTRRLATELRPEDGPVQRLGERVSAVVVRGRDGTVGWLDEPLGPVVEAPVLVAPHHDDPFALIDAARPWIGTPYRLGGITTDGIDCSALVQRLCRQTLGIIVPRHSSDQLQIAPRPGEGRGPGDLSFVWSDREARCHVGIGTGTTVIHASLSRRRVVEDPHPGFWVDARRTMHVPFAQLLAFGRRTAGAPSLVAAGFLPGADGPT
ncbi:MAG: NlpC/P60 family protein [Myxococcota bacterium]